jgi:hypothetical protein
MMRNTGGIIPEPRDDTAIDVFSELYEIYKEVSHSSPNQAADTILNDLAFSVFVRGLRLRRSRDGASDFLPKVLDEARDLWTDFVAWGRENAVEFGTSRIDKKTGEKSVSFSPTKWRRSSRFPNDIDAYMNLLAPVDSAVP